MKILNVIILLFLSIPLIFAGLSGPTPIPNPPNFYLYTSATAICRGQTNNIPIIITNKATTQGNPHNINHTGPALIGPNPTMQDVVLSLISTKGLYPSGNGTVVLGNINPNTSANTYLPVFVAGNASSFISTGISINYFFDSYYSDSEVRNITFAVESCHLPLSISVTPEVLVSGTIQNITINLTNSGTTTLNSISAHFTIPGVDGTWLSQQPIQIQSIAPNTTLLLSKRIYIASNQSDQSVPLNASVIFYNGSEINQLYQNFEILAGGLIDLSSSSFTISPTNPNPNSIFSISFIITDTGTAGASAMIATPLPPPGFSTFGSNSTFIGSISPDSQTPVTLSLMASNSVKPGRYEIPIKLNYLNNLRQNLTAWANTTIFISKPTASNFQTTSNFRSNQSKSGAGGIILLLIAIILIIGFLYYKELKRSGRTITIAKKVVIHGSKKDGA